MEGKGTDMLEKHERELRQIDKILEAHRGEIDKLNREYLEQREIVLELKMGVREINNMVTGLAGTVGDLRRTIEKDGESTRLHFEQAFQHILGVKKKETEDNGKFMLAKLNTKEKVILGIVSVFGSSGFLLGIAALLGR